MHPNIIPLNSEAEIKKDDYKFLNFTDHKKENYQHVYHPGQVSTLMSMAMSSFVWLFQSEMLKYKVWRKFIFLKHQRNLKTRLKNVVLYQDVIDAVGLSQKFIDEKQKFVFYFGEQFFYRFTFCQILN